MLLLLTFYFNLFSQRICNWERVQSVCHLFLQKNVSPSYLSHSNNPKKQLKVKLASSQNEPWFSFKIFTTCLQGSPSALLLEILWTRSEVVKKTNRSTAKNLISKKDLAVFRVQNKLLSLFWGNHATLPRKVALRSAGQGDAPRTAAAATRAGSLPPGYHAIRLDGGPAANHLPLVSHCLWIRMLSGNEVLGSWSRKYFKACFHWCFLSAVWKGGI